MFFIPSHSIALREIIERLQSFVFGDNHPAIFISLLPLWIQLPNAWLFIDAKEVGWFIRTHTSLILQTKLLWPALLIRKHREMPLTELQPLHLSRAITPHPARGSQHPRPSEFLKQRQKIGINTYMATPQDNRLHSPARQIGGMTL